MDKYVNPNTIVFSYILVQDSITSVDEKTSANDNNFLLRLNYPNPFNSVTRIEFLLGKSENTTIKVYNSLGKEITTLVNEYLPSGKQAITWDGKDNNGNTVSSGVYFIQMTAGVYRQTIKAVLLK
jgi:flagellar hook assembly protein FlgD